MHIAGSSRLTHDFFPRLPPATFACRIDSKSLFSTRTVRIAVATYQLRIHRQT